jgi:hypothetical protein
MAKKRHESKLTEKIVRQIEHVLPKLKYSVYMQQVRSWLENFEENEVDHALDFLFYLDYIPFSELQLRLNQQLTSLNEYFDNKKKYLLVPYAEYPKSNDIVMYLIAKCPAYKKLEKENRISYAIDIKNSLIEEDTVLVYVDDFIGTAKSFHTWYRKNKIANIFGANPRIYEEQAILAAIIMEDGYRYMSYYYPEVRVFAEYRPKIFCKINSPFNLSGNRAEMRSLCLKYGSGIITRFHRPNKAIYDPFGFDKSESLVAFDYGTPNNSLPIIWCDKEWKPIFPRTAESRMKKSSEIKSEAAFYLGLMHKLNIYFNEDVDLIIDDENIRLTARDDHAILVYVILIEKNYSPLQICQVLGITLFELDKIVLKAHNKFLVSRKGKLTRRGINFLTQLKKKSNIFKFRTKNALDVRDSKVFVPKSFRNMS